MALIEAPCCGIIVEAALYARCCPECGRCPKCSRKRADASEICERCQLPFCPSCGRCPACNRNFSEAVGPCSCGYVPTESDVEWFEKQFPVPLPDCTYVATHGRRAAYRWGWPLKLTVLVGAIAWAIIVYLTFARW